MIRTIIQQGDASRPTHTIEFEEKEILWKKLVESEQAPPELLVAISGEVVVVTDPDVIDQLWKPEKKKKK